MPTYDYSCQDCGHHFEASQSIMADPLVDCPDCQKPALKRGIGGGSATFQFKGSGFYLTDYKKPCHSGPAASCACKKSES